MNLKQVALSVAVLASLTTGMLSCKSQEAKDAETKAKIEAAAPGVSVTVKDGVATISGEFATDTERAAAEEAAKKVAGVKSVVNNVTVTPPMAPPASITTMLDATTQQKVLDGLKDIKGVTVAFNGEKAVLTGEVSKADRMKIMQILAAANVKSDATQLMDKK
jgi:hyperosmotically inducible protein